MSDASQAVFLSYASQDADAARRLAESLRAAGVEVWFDQSELVGGDAWDAKIRKQIAECALFVPVISAATQARLEGYFRLEWKLAAQRTLTMAEEKVFLLPVVIDDTRDVEAKVPAEFRAVQWTRLRLVDSGGPAPLVGDDVMAKFCTRVLRLLEGDADPFAVRAGRGGLEEHGEPVAGRRRSRGRLVAILATVAIVALTLGVTLWRRTPAAIAEKSSFTAPKPAVAETISAARQLANKALTAVNSGANGPALSAAAKEAEHATTMDELDGEVWAISALVDLAAYEKFVDHSEQRAAAIRAKVEKAQGLAPRAPLTRYAEAKSLIRVDGSRDALAAALELLQTLRAEHPREPDEPGILGMIGMVQQGQGHFEEAARTLEQAGSDWANAACWAYLFGGNLNQALAMAKRQASFDPIEGTGQEALVQFARGDLRTAGALLESLPVSARVSESALGATVAFAYLHHDAQALLDAGLRYPRPFFLANSMLLLPRGYYVGTAYAWLGRAEAARAEWTETLRLVDARLAAESPSKNLTLARLFLLMRLGKTDEATEELKTFRQRIQDSSARLSVAGLLTALGRTDEALDEMEHVLRSDLGYRWSSHPWFRYDPLFDPLRGLPRFQKLLREFLLPGALPLTDAEFERKR